MVLVMQLQLKNSTTNIPGQKGIIEVENSLNHQIKISIFCVIFFIFMFSLKIDLNKKKKYVIIIIIYALQISTLNLLIYLHKFKSQSIRKPLQALTF